MLSNIPWTIDLIDSLISGGIVVSMAVVANLAYLNNSFKNQIHNQTLHSPDNGLNDL